jgi:L-fucose mutarotase/ribose pyranase (RbsD/FucU family)
MLIGIDPLLSGDALAILRDMGHGDSIALVDASCLRVGGSRG